jgi:hypothetical protein|tara:strand:+ start:2199 stop:3062 length:864 start_codon:yes stop_codon:yes gene_type:complete
LTSYQQHRPRVQLALSQRLTAQIAAHLQEWEVGFTSSDPASILNADGPTRLMGASALFVEINAASIADNYTQLQDILEKLAVRRRVVAVMDPASLDEIGPLMDVPNLEFLVWPGKKEELMGVLQPIDLSKRVAEHVKREGQIDLDSLRGEIERIAQALGALVSASGQPRETASANERTPIESARLIRGIIDSRRARTDFFPPDLFADPAWDILLDLAAARHEGVPVSISSLCIAANVPTTTGLRWIKGLTDSGLLVREADPEDGRRSFVTLSDDTAALMERYLDVIA